MWDKNIEYQTNASRALALGCFGGLSIVLSLVLFGFIIPNGGGSAATTQPHVTILAGWRSGRCLASGFSYIPQQRDSDSHRA